MQKNKEISPSKIYTIAISTIFIASFMLSGSQFTQQALAIHEGNATAATTQDQIAGGNTTTTGATDQNQITGGNTTTTGATSQNQSGFDGNTTATDTTTQNQAAAGGNASDAGATPTPTPTAATQEPSVNQNFVSQATVASEPNLLAGQEGDENVAFILPPRNDDGVYSGVLTYTASKPVEVVVVHNYDPQNSTAIPEEYGTEFTANLPDGSGNIAITLFQPTYTGDVNAASVPFTGNALALHTIEEGPFTATYTVNAFATQAEDANAPLEFITAAGGDETAAGGDETAAGEEETAAGEEETAAGEEETAAGEEEDAGAGN